jgi:adenylate cyclase
VVFAALGNGERLELTVIGDAVNLAAKLEKHNKALGSRALTTAATWQAAVAQGFAAPAGHRPLDAVTVPAVAAPVDLVVIG